MAQPPPIESPAKSQRIQEHESMQLRDVTFRIEDRCFRVPIQMFGDSETFCAILETASVNDPDAKQAIHLDQISIDEFLCLVKYMNQRRLGGNSVINYVEYVAVLKISTKLGFNTVRAIAIRDFPDVDVVDKIVLARDHGVQEWLVTSLNKYARLGRSITMQDVQRLGTTYILKITQVREKFRQIQSDPVLHEARQRRTFDFAPSLGELFREDIDRLSIQWPPVVLCAAKDFDLMLVEIFFFVEDHLFKSYRQFFEDSPVFQTMFSLPIGENDIREGSTKSQPLRLEGITRSDFAPFVALINPGTSPEIKFSYAEWISILDLSTMWEFTAIRQYAITEISKLGISLTRRIKLARDYHIQEWLLSGLVAYAQQPDIITPDDVDLLGWEYILKILQARERFMVPSRYFENDYKPGIEARVNHNFTVAIEEVFQEEIERIGQVNTG